VLNDLNISYRILASAYQSGAYNGSTYNGSSTTSTSQPVTTTTKAATSSSTATTNDIVSVQEIDNQSYTFGSTIIISSTPTFKGTAPANSKVSVSIGSSICTATADSNGNWSCQITSLLTSGPYSVSITATEPSGKVINYSPFEVQVSSTKAVSKNVIYYAKTTPKTSTGSNASYIGYSLLAFILFVAIAFILLGIIKRRKDKDDEEDNGSSN
jgi:hypothetical protein